MPSNRQPAMPEIYLDDVPNTVASYPPPPSWSCPTSHSMQSRSGRHHFGCNSPGICSALTDHISLSWPLFIIFSA